MKLLKKASDLLFTNKGRIDRKQFLLSIILIYLLGLVVMVWFTSIGQLLAYASWIENWEVVTRFVVAWLIWVGLPLCIYAMICTRIKRFHDLGKKDSEAYRSMIPIYSFFCHWYLLLARWDDWANQYGEQP